MPPSSPKTPHHLFFLSRPFYSLCQQKEATETSIVADEHDEESKQYRFLLRPDHYYTHRKLL
ncbi:hypothetical protein Hdeb2414_s0004g00143921 [Helianthus debilis subsp. tardiflorus]